VGHIGQQRPEGDDAAGADLASGSDDLLAERTPTQLWLEAEQHGDVVAARRRPPGEEFVLGPRDRAVAVLVEVHQRPGGAEVVIAFRIDRCEWGGVEPFGEMTRGDRGGVASVVPTLECDDENRVAEIGRGPEPLQIIGGVLDHRDKLSACRSNQSVGAVRRSSGAGWLFRLAVAVDVRLSGLEPNALV
jgi:hypothetical protein